MKLRALGVLTSSLLALTACGADRAGRPGQTRLSRTDAALAQAAPKDDAASTRAVVADANGAAPIAPQAPLANNGKGTELRGALETRTLRKAESPFRVTGDLLVPLGHTLTIEPGVVLDFQGHSKLDVDGHLKAIGTAQERIVFTAKRHADWPKADGAERGWNGIRFWPYTSESRAGEEDWLEHCELSYANKTGNNEDSTHGSYVESTGGAVYITGRPSAMQGSAKEVPVTFHFNHNFVHHNIANRAGGGLFHIIPGSIRGGRDGVFNGLAIGNVFEDNQCDALGTGYAGCGWSAFHDGASINHTFRGGAFRRNKSVSGAPGFQVGTIESWCTLDAVIVNPATPGWSRFDPESALTLTNGSPLPDR